MLLLCGEIENMKTKVAETQKRLHIREKAAHDAEHKLAEVRISEKWLLQEAAVLKAVLTRSQNEQKDVDTVKQDRDIAAPVEDNLRAAKAERRRIMNSLTIRAEQRLYLYISGRVLREWRAKILWKTRRNELCQRRHLVSVIQRSVHFDRVSIIA
jgi:hypothetical protein